MAATRESGTHLIPIASIKLSKKARGFGLRIRRPFVCSRVVSQIDTTERSSRAFRRSLLNRSARSCPAINQIQACVSRTYDIFLVGIPTQFFNWSNDIAQNRQPGFCTPKKFSRRFTRGLNWCQFRERLTVFGDRNFLAGLLDPVHQLEASGFEFRG
jgi:hypothetical protein